MSEKIGKADSTTEWNEKQTVQQESHSRGFGYSRIDVVQPIDVRVRAETSQSPSNHQSPNGSGQIGTRSMNGTPIISFSSSGEAHYNTAHPQVPGSERSKYTIRQKTLDPQAAVGQNQSMPTYASIAQAVLPKATKPSKHDHMWLGSIKPANQKRNGARQGKNNHPGQASFETPKVTVKAPINAPQLSGSVQYRENNVLEREMQQKSGRNFTTASAAQVLRGKEQRGEGEEEDKGENEEELSAQVMLFRQEPSAALVVPCTVSKGQPPQLQI